MAPSVPSASRKWLLEDVVNFETALHAEQQDQQNAAPPAARLELPEEVRIGIATLSQSHPENARRQAFRLWLHAKTRDADPETLPGALLRNALKLGGFILSLTAFAAGVALVIGLLERPEKAFNVPIFFAATVLLQLVLLLAMLASWAFRRVIFGSSALTLFQSAVRSLVLFLANRLSPAAQKKTRSLRARYASSASILRWPVIALTQSAAIFFNLGLIAAFAYCLLFTDVLFYWESTPAVAADTALHRLTNLVAAPWSSWQPGWAPTLDGIQATQLHNVGGEPRRIPTSPAEIWYPFLLCSLAVWGLFPRILLRLAAAAAQHRALAKLAFTQRAHRDLWRRLTAVDIHAAPEKAADGAIVLNWNGIDFDQDELRRHILQQLHLNPLRTLTAGAGSQVDDRQTLDSLAEAEDIRGIAILAEAWNLIPARLIEFHRDLRAAVGHDLPVTFFLIGNPTAGTPFTEPAEETLPAWQDLADSFNDSLLDIRPFRASRHPTDA